MNDGEALWRTDGKPVTNIPNWFEEIKKAKYSRPDYSVIEQYHEDMRRALEGYIENQRWLMLNGGEPVYFYY